MSRPAKSIDTQSRNNTKEEIQMRKEVEESLSSCGKEKIKPPKYLTKEQKKIFKFIITELHESDILCNLDIYILTTCAIAIDRLNFIEQRINETPEELTNKDLMSAKDKYTKDLYRCCNELSLSPQSRAKIGSLNLNVKKEKESPLAKILSGIK